MRSLLAALLFANLVLGGCVNAGNRPSAPAFASLEQEDRAIYTAVLEAMYTRWESYGPYLGLPKTYFISIQQKDAPNDLLESWKQKGRDVHPGSVYRHGLGVSLSLQAIERDGDQRAKVEGGYLFGDLGGEWGPFLLSRENGAWKVLSWEPNMFAQKTPNQSSQPTRFARG
jgi:hypothetical protein